MAIRVHKIDYAPAEVSRKIEKIVRTYGKLHSVVPITETTHRATNPATQTTELLVITEYDE